jgi:hypothetical protein
MTLSGGAGRAAPRRDAGRVVPAGEGRRAVRVRRPAAHACRVRPDDDGDAGIGGPTGKPLTGAAQSSQAASLRSGEGWQERRGREALRSLTVQDSSGFQVIFSQARDGYYGLTRLRARTVEVYVRSCEEQPRELLRHIVAHELGHAHDATRNTAHDRAAWLAARQLPPGTPWYGCSGCVDFGTPAGDYAELYAQWARGAATNRSSAAPVPDAAALAALAERFFTR